MNNRKLTVKAPSRIKRSNPKSGIKTFNRLEKKVKSLEKKPKPVIFAQKIEPKAKKIDSKKILRAVKPKSKKPAVAALVKTSKLKVAVVNKSKTQKLAFTNKKVTSGGKKIQLGKAVRTIKPKTKVKSILVVGTPKSKTRNLKPIASAKQIKSVGKKKISSVSARKVKKPNSVMVEFNVSKKPVRQKIKKSLIKVAPAQKAKGVEKKVRQNTAAQKTKTQRKNIKSAKTIQPTKSKARKISRIVPAVKIDNKKTRATPAKSNESVFVKKIKSEKQSPKPTAFARTIKLERNKVIKAKTKKIAQIVPAKKATAIKIETVNLPVEKKLIKKKNKPIGSAVFRGRKDRYDFKVFPLDNEFENVSAIYIISRRKIDRQKKGHHALVCIGQTDSILGEIKRHKNKCIKKHNANVISILPETDARKRLRIEEDLKAAHVVACSLR